MIVYDLPNRLIVEWYSVLSFALRRNKENIRSFKNIPVASAPQLQSRLTSVRSHAWLLCGRAATAMLTRMMALVHLKVRTTCIALHDCIHDSSAGQCVSVSSHYERVLELWRNLHWATAYRDLHTYYIKLTQTVMYISFFCGINYKGTASSVVHLEAGNRRNHKSCTAWHVMMCIPFPASIPCMILQYV